MRKGDYKKIPTESGDSFWRSYGILTVGFIILGIATIVLAVIAWHGIEDKKAAPTAAVVMPEEEKKGEAQAPAPASPPKRMSLASMGVLGLPGGNNVGAGEQDAKPQIISGGSSKNDEQTAVSLMQIFRTATDWKEKRNFVAEPDRVGPMMQSFYEVHHRSDPKMGEFMLGRMLKWKGREFFHLIYKGSGMSPQIECALFPQPDGSLRLDWESLVGAGEMDWADFKTRRPFQPVLMRGFAELSAYYNFEFDDSGKWLALKIHSPDDEEIVYAYAERGSPVAEKIITNVARDELRPVTLRLAFPNGARSNNHVKIVDWVSNAWFLP